MKKKVQQAIVAARAGEIVQAQGLLTDVLEQDEQDVQAWFLLSNLVDSDEKRSVFLQKTLDLDPAYQPALDQLDEDDELIVGEAVAPQTTEVLEEDTVVSSVEEDPFLAALMADDAEEEMTFSADDFVADELDEMVEMDTAVSQTQPIADVKTVEVAAVPPTVELDAAELPTKTVTAVPEPKAETSITAEPAESSRKAVVKKEAPKKQKKAEPASLTGMLYLLGALTIITFLALLYFVLF